MVRDLPDCVRLIGRVGGNSRVLQVGYALSTRHVFEKRLNAYGVSTVALDPMGLQTSESLAIVGNILVELGLVMGAYDAAEIAAVPFGGTLKPQEHAREWCASISLGPTTQHVPMSISRGVGPRTLWNSRRRCTRCRLHIVPLHGCYGSTRVLACRRCGECRMRVQVRCVRRA